MTADADDVEPIPGKATITRVGTISVRRQGEKEHYDIDGWAFDLRGEPIVAIGKDNSFFGWTPKELVEIIKRSSEWV